MDPDIQSVFGRCHGVVLTCLADPLSLRTVPAAAGVLGTARVANPRLELLGVLIGQYSAFDLMQAPMLARLRQMHGELMLEPPVPHEQDINGLAFSPDGRLLASAGADRTIRLWDTGASREIQALRGHGRIASKQPGA